MACVKGAGHCVFWRQNHVRQKIGGDALPLLQLAGGHMPDLRTHIVGRPRGRADRHLRVHITAIGFAFREFATEVLRAVGCACKNTVFPGADREFSAEELTYRMSGENFAEFLEEYKQYPDITG